MKLSTILLALLAATALRPANAGDKITILDPENDRLVSDFYLYKDKGQSGSVETMDGKKAFVADFNCQEAPHCEFFLSTGKSIPLAFSKAKVTVELYLPEDNKVRVFSLRFADRDGEIFNYPCPVKTPRKGWQTIEFDLAAPSNSWGGNDKANHRLDLPLKPYAYTINFTSRTGTGRLGIGKIEAEILEPAK